MSFLQDVRAEAEQRVYEKLNQKMDEFLDLGDHIITCHT
jgi:hypothetical protein